MPPAPPPTAPTWRRRPLLRASAGAALALPFLGRGAQAATTWTLFTQQANPSSVVARGLRRLSDQLRDRTHGALLLNVRTAGLMPVDANEVLDGVATGKIAIGDDGNYGATIGSGMLMRLPLLATTPAEWAKVAEVVRPGLEAELEQRGLVLLAHYRRPKQLFWSRTRAASFADLSRQRIRVQSQEQAEFLRHYAAVHVITSSVETAEALAAGKLDGTFSAAAVFGRAWKAWLKHVYLAGPNYNDSIIVARREALAQLPEGIAPVLMAVGAEAGAWITQTHDREELQVLAALAVEGLKATPADPAEIREGMRRVPAYWDTWARLRGPETENLLASVRLVLDR
jgi:TRAP-type C4-dicarboxylate transport system substrate-binding protein